jgi:PAS domain-containing protein
MSCQAAIIIHDTHRIIGVSEGMCELFRCDAHTLIDLPLIDLLADPDWRGLARLRMQTMRTIGKLKPLEYTCLRFDGTEFVARIDTHPIVGEAGSYRTELTYLYEAP